jgi:phosphoglycolate phosphatase
MKTTKQRGGVLFDLDGTLMHTAPDLGAAVNRILAEYQQPPLPEAKVNQTASHGALGLLQAGFGDKLSEEMTPILRQRLLDYYEALEHQYTHLFDGVQEAIDWLDGNAIPWGIVTNKPAYLSHPLLAKFAGKAKCASLVGGDTLTVRKPNPQPLYYACDQMGVSAGCSLYVGDAERDIEAGRNAGMATVLAGWGYLSDTDQPHLWGADYTCAHSAQLQQTLERWFIGELV